jgi:hypothetical protein
MVHTRETLQSDKGVSQRPRLSRKSSIYFRNLLFKRTHKVKAVIKHFVPSVKTFITHHIFKTNTVQKKENSHARVLNKPGKNRCYKIRPTKMKGQDFFPYKKHTLITLPQEHSTLTHENADQFRGE